jgi:hypothetical protein
VKSTLSPPNGEFYDCCCSYPPIHEIHITLTTEEYCAPRLVDIPQFLDPLFPNHRQNWGDMYRFCPPPIGAVSNGLLRASYTLHRAAQTQEQFS